MAMYCVLCGIPSQRSSKRVFLEKRGNYFEFADFFLFVEFCGLDLSVALWDDFLKENNLLQQNADAVLSYSFFQICVL
jgi:hypothetical protein